MKKILCSLVLIFAMLISVSSAFAYEYAPYVGNEIIRATSVILTDAEGNEVTSLVPGETVTATVRVNIGDESLTGSEKVSLILTAYSGRFLRAVDFDTKTISSSETFTASVTVPAIEPSLRVFLWDEIDGNINARALFSMGETPAESMDIEQISVGGVMLENFDPDIYEYDVTVNAGYLNWPEVIVYSENTSIKVSAQYDGTFPLSLPDYQLVDAQEKVVGTSKTAVATITAGDKTYKINVTQEVPQITDVRLTYKNVKTKVDEVWPDVKNVAVYMSANIQNPKWTDEFPGPNKESATGMTNDRKNEYYQYVPQRGLSGSSPAHAVNGWLHTVYNLSPELIGGQQIVIQRASTTAGPNLATESDDYLSFALERSARVYAYVGSDASVLPSSDGWCDVVNEIYNTNEKAVRSIYARYMGTSPTSYSSYNISPMRYLDVEVTPGEKVNVVIPKGGAIGYTFIKYKEGSDFVSNASYKYGTTEETAKAVKIFKPLLIDDTLTGSDLYLRYKSKQSESAASSKDVPYDGTGNVLYASSCFSDAVSCVPVEYDERFEGAQCLKLATSLPQLQGLKFDISAPAKVYVLTNLTEEADISALRDCLADWDVIGEREDKLIEFYNTLNGTETSYILSEKTSFEKAIYTDYGETVTVNIDTSSMNFPEDKVFMVIIQPLD